MSDGFSLRDAVAEFGPDGLVPKLLPDGEYVLELKKVTPGKTASGKQRFVLNWSVVGGPNDGKIVTDTMTWSPESEVAARIFMSQLKKMGATKEWIDSADPSQEQIAARITGARMNARLSAEEWQGEMRNKIALGAAISVGTGGANAGVSASAADAEDLGDLSEEAESVGEPEDLPAAKTTAKVTTTTASEDVPDWP